MKTVVGIVMALLLTITVCNASDIYRYTDAKGVIHLTDSPVEPSISYKKVYWDSCRQPKENLTSSERLQRIIHTLTTPTPRQCR